MTPYIDFPSYFLKINDEAQKSLEMSPPSRQPEKLSSIVEDDWEWRLSDLPEFATSTGDHRYDDRLDDRSIAAYKRRQVAASHT